MDFKKCTYCGNGNDLNSVYCEYCGKELNDNGLDDSICSNCGIINRFDSKFCKQCGQKLKNDNVLDYSYDIICPFCDSLIPSHSLKCRYCGEWIDKKAEYQNTNNYTFTIVLGYIFTFLGGIIGFIIACYLVSRENPRAEKHGKILLAIFLIYAILILITFYSIIP